MKFWLKFKELYRTLLSSKATSQEVAFGFAIGVFIALTPTMGFQTPMALGLSLLFRTNKISALIGVFVTNPLTAFPIYSAIYVFGKFLLGDSFHSDIDPKSMSDFIKYSGQIFIPLWAGGIVSGLIGGVISYFMALYGYPILKRRKKKVA